MITTDLRTAPKQKLDFHPVVKVIAKIISILFHPLFIPLYVIWFLLYHQTMFSGLTPFDKVKVFISFVVNYTLLPIVTVLLMRALGFVQSFYLKTQRDRILPYVVCQIFFFWGWYVARNNHWPEPVVLFTLAVFLSSAAGLIMNVFMKISMHTISLGVLLTFALIMGMRAEDNFGFYIAIALFVCGLTATARLIDSDHTTFEVYAGFALGTVIQLLSLMFV